MPLLKSVFSEAFAIGRRAASLYLMLLKIMVPALVIIKALDLLGCTQWLAWLLSPLMQLMGLPDSLGVVWATVMLTNIYTAMVVFFQVAGSEPLTTAQLTVLGSLMLLAHFLPVEGAVARRAGVPWHLTLMLRIGGALLLGSLLNALYSATGWLQEPGTVLWPFRDGGEAGLVAWGLGQLKTLLWILPTIAALLTLLRLLHLLGIEKAIHWLLFPLLRLMGIGRAAANVTIVGVTLGLTYGAGMLIEEARSGKLSRRDVMLTLAFLGLCHSVIEDTLLVLLVGADLSGILWARLAFAVLVVSLLARLPWPGRRRVPASAELDSPVKLESEG
ncbi:hypothetical protein PVT67_03845 [Gallaecimonas kandeliae]|uniref:hypothetical protein n=1 Tax=Gallaecimonas kandeliae TaxID=3029055 RepID=UPI0026496294|nr:hypothetical protein [Gallaecimonas kandeliae]WKE66394.1 hypothetical protein PVT67_03845 [Gallaecimonas kandeliae]